MAGEYVAGTRPPLPGSYFDFEVEEPAPTYVNTLGVQAIPFTHSWGPAGKVVTLDKFADFLSVFGQGGTTPPDYTPGYKAVSMAFQGEGLPGRGGAVQVLAYRMVGSSAASSTLKIKNTSDASALTLDAKYIGSYGDKISYTNTANVRNLETQSDFTILVNDQPTEVFTYDNTDIASLADLINDSRHGSKWVTATETATGTALSVQSTPVSLDGGDDGSTLAAGDWTDMMAAFGVTSFGVFTPFDLTAADIRTSLVTWAEGLNAHGRCCEVVIGGAANDTATAATTRASNINNENFITGGVGTYSDATFGTLTTSQLAPRLGGIVAARGDSAGLSFARLAGLDIIDGPSDLDILESITGGWMAIGRDSNQAAPIRYEKGVTTYTGGNDRKPFSVYSNPKFIATMHDIELTIGRWQDGEVIGIAPVDQKTVDHLIGWVKGYFKRLETDEIVQPGWWVVRNPDPAPTPEDDFIALLYAVSFMRDTEQVLNKVVVR